MLRDCVWVLYWCALVCGVVLALFCFLFVFVYYFDFGVIFVLGCLCYIWCCSRLVLVCGGWLATALQLLLLILAVDDLFIFAFVVYCLVVYFVCWVCCLGVFV